MSATASKFQTLYFSCVEKMASVLCSKGLQVLRINDSYSTLRLNNSGFLRGSVLGHCPINICVSDLEFLVITRGAVDSA